ncbi:MAG: hypothetical protein AAGA43_07175 [Bacteroidota bacterium]
MTQKNLASIAFAIISLSAYSQKVKVKKDVILIDKQETPLRVTENKIENNTIYTFTDSGTGEVFLKVDYVLDEINESNKYEWLVLSKEGVDFENEVDMEYVSFTLNYRKAIAEFLMKRLNFFDASGQVNKDVISDYFSEERERESKEEYEQLVSQEREAGAKFAQTSSLGIAIDPDYKRIFRGGIPYTSSSVDDRKRNAEVVENMIGSYRFSNPTTLVVRDLDNVKIGTITQDAFGVVTIVSQLLTSPITYETRNRFSPTDKYGTKDFLIEAVRWLHARGVELGHSAKEAVALANAEIKAEAQEAYEEAKASSSNFYNKKGYVIDEKGMRYEGEVTMLFDDIPDPNNPESGGTMVNLNGSELGRKVKVAYVNEKDKKRIKTVSAKSGVRFCVFEDDGQETWFEGIKVKSNGLLASSDDAISIGNSALFMKEVHKEGKASVFQYPATGKYYLKTNGQEKAFSFEFGQLIKEAKKASKLKEYLGGCDYNSGSYDESSFQDLEEIKILVDFYNNSCK